jgi:tight adherence protein B
MVIGVLALLIFVAVVVGGYALSTMLGTREEAAQVLRRRLATVTGVQDGTVRTGVLKDQRLSAIGALNTFLARFGIVTALVRMIERAGLRKRAGEIVLYAALAACTTFLLVALYTDKLMLGILAGAVGGFAPLFVVRRIGRGRAMLFAEQLPDALDLVRAALQSGHGLMSALSVVADEFPDPIAQEFRDVTEEVRLGLPLRDALDKLAERVNNPDVPLLQTGILVAQEIGGNLAEVLDNIGYTIRERYKVQREMRVLTAQGRLSGGVLTAMPFVAALGMSIFNPDYYTPLLHSQSGHYMLAYGAVSLLLGHLVIRRLVRVKV